jgi:alanyl-tRNA synthetase
MKSQEIRQKYIDFFKTKGHAVIPSASLIPENDPTVLFNTAGMQPLTPYLMGEKHPEGKRIVNYQKCVRTVEIDEDNSIGDKTHHTFFEMLGNWSLGDYFKKETIEWSFEFLTKKKWLGLDPLRIYVSIFKGNKNTKLDKEAGEIWKKQFKKIGIEALIYGIDEKTEKGEYRIFPLDESENWWGPAGETGPCGPDTEIFYYVGSFKKIDIKKERLGFNDGNFVEIWNNVFMEFNRLKNDSGGFKFESLANKNVDTGMGLERITSIMQGKFDNYKTDLFLSIRKEVEKIVDWNYEDNIDVDKSIRIVSDHIRASVFIAGDGIRPSNVDQGYILRRLIRRSIRHIRSAKRIKDKAYGYKGNCLKPIAIAVIENYKNAYPALAKNRAWIISVIETEEDKFAKTLERGMKKFEEIVYREQADNQKINGKVAFDLYQTYGFPIEITEEMANEREMEVDVDGFKKELLKHRELSRKGALKKFKGGLSDDKKNTVKLHTAAHLLLAGLRKFLGDGVFQKGSNITSERLRFDFSYHEKTPFDKLKMIEEFVNEAIKENIEVKVKEMPLNEAKKSGAMGVFDDRYNTNVKVYTIEGYSNEICGGPHVKKTGELGRFKIKKEQSVGSGIRRVKAILE